jgi:hypothetical protein
MCIQRTIVRSHWTRRTYLVLEYVDPYAEKGDTIIDYRQPERWYG